MRHDAAAIILAGGKSLRMGQDKGLLPIGGIPMFQHIANQLTPFFSDALIVANQAEAYRGAGLRIVPDEQQGIGPLMGILSGLSASTKELNFVTACDIPNMNMDFIAELLKLADGCDAVIPVTGDDMYEPLFAVYRKTVIPAIREIIGQGNRRIIELLTRVKVCTIQLPGADWYHNINTIQDYRNIVEPL
jgi:molybdopterin-guanine dinucleotide biosynthesis protein A